MSRHSAVIASLAVVLGAGCGGYPRLQPDFAVGGGPEVVVESTKGPWAHALQFPQEVTEELRAATAWWGGALGDLDEWQIQFEDGLVNCNSPALGCTWGNGKVMLISVIPFVEDCPEVAMAILHHEVGHLYTGSDVNHVDPRWARLAAEQPPFIVCPAGSIAISWPHH